MASLAEIQRIFSNAVIDVERPYPPSIKQVYDEKRTKMRFDIYRNNVFVALIDMIEARFPVVLRLLGDEFFRGTARSYTRAHPPGIHPSIAYGATFPEYLKTFPPVEDLPYLPDVAALEWACHESRFAKDEPTLAIDDALNRLSQSSQAKPSLHVHSAARVVGSNFPIKAVWETNTHDEDVETINLNTDGQDVLVTRPHCDVFLAQLPIGGAQFFNEVCNGRTLDEALERAQKTMPDMNAEEVLVCLLRAGAISEIAI